MEFAALRELRRNKSIVILKPDKGNGVVILNKSDYISKIDTILADSSKFVKTTGRYEDPFSMLNFVDTKVRDLLRDLKKKKCISDNDYMFMYPTGCKISTLYGLPKVHKQGCPIRPILSSVGSVNHNMAKFLVKILQPISVNPYTCRDTHSFVNDIKGLKFGSSF